MSLAPVGVTSPEKVTSCRSGTDWGLAGSIGLGIKTLHSAVERRTNIHPSIGHDLVSVCYGVGLCWGCKPEEAAQAARPPAQRGG